MSAKRAKSRQKPAAVGAQVKQLMALFQGWGRGVPLVILTIVAFAALWYTAWREVGQKVLSQEPYWLTWEDVEITPPPEWIEGDIREEIFDYVTLDGPLSIMNQELTARIANAFSLHPWVATVHRVRKCHPAHVRVELEYRRPVCVVQAPDELLPVDEQGVLLPSVSDEKARAYPRIEGVDTVPIGGEGTRWGDARVSGGAKIAAALGPAWQRLGLARIVPAGLVAVSRADQYSFEIFTSKGTRIVWGRAPGLERLDEALAADKLSWLLEYCQQHGSLDGPPPQMLDVRRLEAPETGSQTAAKAEKPLL